ncbi:unnamed protein product [Lathyrus oleraceus]
MFLLCNGLLVFVGITISLSTGSSSVDESSNNVKDGSRLLFSMVEAKVPVLVMKGDQEEESRLFDEGGEEEDNELQMVDEEEILEEANWVINTDELNKKFDDFIKRMKEDLRIEAQRQFLMV